MAHIVSTGMPHFGFCECSCGCQIYGRLITDLHVCSGEIIYGLCIEGLCEISKELRDTR